MSKIKLTQAAKHRLPKLSAFLRTVPRPVFNLSAWVDHDPTLVNKAGALRCALPFDDVKKCGSAACAVGWGATIPAFQAAGFRVTSNAFDPTWMEPTFAGMKGFEAVEGFFGIKNEVAETLFLPDAYPAKEATTPVKVANRIDAYLRDPDAFEKKMKEGKLD